MIAQNKFLLPKTPRQVAAVLNKSYCDLGGIYGLIVRARPYICPFEELLNRVDYGEEMLDVGCGAGSFSILLAHYGVGKRILGIDKAESVIVRARAARQIGQGRARFLVMKPGVYPQQKFDAVVCIDVLHHVPWQEQRNFIYSIGLLIKPGGQMIIKDISPRPRWKALANRAHDVIISNQWVNYRTAQVVANWLEDDGLAVMECSRLDRWWYGHYLVVAGANKNSSL